MNTINTNNDFMSNDFIKNQILKVQDVLNKHIITIENDFNGLDLIIDDAQVINNKLVITFDDNIYNDELIIDIQSIIAFDSLNKSFKITVLNLKDEEVIYDLLIK